MHEIVIYNPQIPHQTLFGFALPSEHLWRQIQINGLLKQLPIPYDHHQPHRITLLPIIHHNLPRMQRLTAARLGHPSIYRLRQPQHHCEDPLWGAGEDLDEILEGEFVGGGEDLAGEGFVLEGVFGEVDVGGTDPGHVAGQVAALGLLLDVGGKLGAVGVLRGEAQLGEVAHRVVHCALFAY